MTTIQKIKDVTKGRAAATAGSLFLANPLIGMFLAGVGLAIWYSAKKRSSRPAY